MRSPFSRFYVVERIRTYAIKGSSWPVPCRARRLILLRTAFSDPTGHLIRQQSSMVWPESDVSSDLVLLVLETLRGTHRPGDKMHVSYHLRSGSVVAHQIQPDREPAQSLQRSCLAPSRPFRPPPSTTTIDHRTGESHRRPNL